MTNNFMLCEKTTEKELTNFTEWKWFANLKYDGERIKAIIKDGSVFLLNRRGNLKNDNYQEICEELKSNFKNCILDGEIITEHDNFNLLQKRALTKDKEKQKILRNEIPIRYMVFDILELQGEDLRSLPLKDRVLKLFHITKEYGNFNKVQLVEYDSILTTLEKAKKENREGIIIKDITSKYENRRSKSWLKLKFFKYMNLNLTEYTINNAGIRAVDPLGNVVQISGDQHNEVKQEIDNKGSCEVIVQYLEKTKENRLRFPSFIGTLKAELKEEKLRSDY